MAIELIKAFVISRLLSSIVIIVGMVNSGNSDLGQVFSQIFFLISFTIDTASHALNVVHFSLYLCDIS